MFNIRGILNALSAAEVAFIVVGGLAAVLQGAPIHTNDLDVVYARTPANIDRLLAVLLELDAVFRTDPRKLAPNRSHLESTGHKLLTTRLGVIDVLATIEEATPYEQLLPHAELFDIDGATFQVLSLERLAEAKRKLDRPKDRLQLMVIEATLDERRRRS